MRIFSKLAPLALGAVLLMGATASNASPVVNFEALGIAELNALTPVANISPSSTDPVYFDNVAGNQTSGSTVIARSPWEGTDHEATGLFSSVQRGGSATFEFATTQNFISLIWGSPDDYNDMTITLSGVAGEHVVNGEDVFGTKGTLASLVEITGVKFDTLLLTTGNTNAFEFANLETAVVPLPAGVVLLLTGLGGMAMLRRKRAAA
jgi:hypothetical protein